MKSIAYVLLALSALLVLVGLYSRVTMSPIGGMGIEASAFLEFAQVLLVFAVALCVLKIADKK